MTDLVIEHGPDSGCHRCPLAELVDPDRSNAAVCRIGSRDVEERYDPAPGWCPLRTARVVVQRPASNS